MLPTIPSEFHLLALCVAFGFGAIIGSFLNVYIYRFHTGKSLTGHSHCLSCGEQLRWFELFPIVSYLVIQGRCRHCKARVPVRYFLVELLTAVLFAFSLTVTTSFVGIGILWLIASILVVIITYDYYHFIIPDSLTIALTLSVVAWTGFEIAQGMKLDALSLDVISAVIGSGFFAFLWLLGKGKWLGFGDVKLAFPLSLLVGAGNVFSFIVLSFWIGAGVSILLLAWQRFGRGKSHLRLLSTTITMKSAVPFAPFLIAGALITFFTHVNVLTLFSFTFI